MDFLQRSTCKYDHVLSIINGNLQKNGAIFYFKSQDDPTTKLVMIKILTQKYANSSFIF